MYVLQRSTRGKTLIVFDLFNKSDNSKFLQIDIVSFYPSITSELLSKAILFAKQHAIITNEEEDIIKHTKNSLLINNSTPWVHTTDRKSANSLAHTC